MLRRQRMYDSTGFRYEQDRYGTGHMRAYGELRSHALARVAREAFPAQTSLNILEVGCGTGISMDFFARLPCKHALYAVDFSRSMLSQAAAKCATLANRPRFVLASGFCLPFPDQTFDMVFATRFIHQFSHDDKKQIYAEVMRVLRPGGVAAVEFYAFWYHWARYHLRERRARTREAFFEHYPTARVVRDIAGAEYGLVPLRIAGARILYAICGQSVLRRVTDFVGRIHLRALLDEYLVVTRK